LALLDTPLHRCLVFFSSQLGNNELAEIRQQPSTMKFISAMLCQENPNLGICLIGGKQIRTGLPFCFEILDQFVATADYERVTHTKQTTGTDTQVKQFVATVDYERATHTKQTMGTDTFVATADHERATRTKQTTGTDTLVKKFVATVYYHERATQTKQTTGMDDSCKTNY
jgi:hypothetical protein